MKVLLSAYACEPGKGSEPGVGWHWATELAKLGHEVDVITRANNEPAISKAMEAAPIAGLRFHYYDLPAWSMGWKQGRKNYHLYYSLWQRGAYRAARKLTRNARFDVVHHVTFAIYRQPSFMGRLGLPFVLGPVGGGERIPPLLRSSLPAKRRRTESLREFVNRVAYWNPSVRAMLRQSFLIFYRTEETYLSLPPSYREKARPYLGIGLEPQIIRHEPSAVSNGAGFLYAGSLIYWKGLHLALKAFAQLKNKKPDATLTVMGSGEDEQWLKGLATGLGVADSVSWLGKLPQSEVWAQYSRHAAFVYPSMHDSGGLVVFESLSQALPVICLDTGGPATILPEGCGIKVPVKNRTEKQVVDDLAASMLLIAENPETRAEMARRALEAARAHLWKDVVADGYRAVADALGALQTKTV